MNRERLTHLMAVLEKVPPEKFDMTRWHCGTAACALGWAAVDPEFIEQGLRLVKDDNSTYPEHNGLVAYAAGRVFFDLKNEHAFLFDPWEYGVAAKDVTAQHVIERIKEMLNEA